MVVVIVGDSCKWLAVIDRINDGLEWLEAVAAVGDHWSCVGSGWKTIGDGWMWLVAVRR